MYPPTPPRPARVFSASGRKFAAFSHSNTSTGVFRSFRSDHRGVTSLEFGVLVAVFGAGLLMAGPKMRDLIASPMNQIASASNSMSVQSCQDATCQGGGAAANTQLSGVR